MSDSIRSAGNLQGYAVLVTGGGTGIGAACAAALAADGAAVTILTDQMNRMHYVMNFANWDVWAKFQDADHPEFEAFMQKQQQDPTARLITVYTASNQ